LKFAPVFPEQFGSLADARIFITQFVEGYNHTHRLSGIGLNAPGDVHYGLEEGKAEDRSAVLAHARAANPTRFGTATDPMVLGLPGPARINKPADQPATEEQ
jgi:hypothetical protein